MSAVPTGGARGIVTGPEPAVIDEELCRSASLILSTSRRAAVSLSLGTNREKQHPLSPHLALLSLSLALSLIRRKCIATVRTRPTQAGEAPEAKKEPTAFKETKSLLLSYQNILKIDNLVGFDKLIKLQLDNNIIEKIENLSHLTSLEALDLSFNNITEISGLDALTNLTTLSLFANRITHLGGLDTLDKLQVLSVGNNLIAQLDNVMYLRPFTKLQAVNLVGNPFCQEDEYR